MAELYGDLPLQAVADFMKRIPEGLSHTQMWVCYGKFLDQYYTEHDMSDTKLNAQPIVDDLLESYKNQHHSGYSHLVATQAIMEYLSGKMSDEDRAKVKEAMK